MYHSVLNNPEASVFMISIAPCRDYANRKIKYLKKKQRPIKSIKPQRGKNKVFFFRQRLNS